MGSFCMTIKVDVIVIGAGAAGLMCGIEAGKRGRRVLILEKTNKAGKKILMSGGGRCNFTNLYTSPAQFISQNPHFCKSAISRYTQWDFIAMVERYEIAYYEKTLGQLFCEHKSKLIVDMLLSECQIYQVDLKLEQQINLVSRKDNTFLVESNGQHYVCQSLVVATGGLSIPTLGSSPFGYQLASQFDLLVHPTRAGLVPFTLHVKDKERYESLTGIAVESEVYCNGQTFKEQVLFTHRGLSGPAILQISSHWNPGDSVVISFLPDTNLQQILIKARSDFPDHHVKTIISRYLPRRLVEVFIDEMMLNKPIKQLTTKELSHLVSILKNWCIKPNATEGYRTAEVTLGGVNCDQISSQRFEVKNVPGLFFVGEVLDVAGWLGGYNFQWAWSSGWAAGQVV